MTTLCTGWANGNNGLDRLFTSPVFGQYEGFLNVAAEAGSQVRTKWPRTIEELDAVVNNLWTVLGAQKGTLNFAAAPAVASKFETNLMTGKLCRQIKICLSVFGLNHTIR